MDLEVQIDNKTYKPINIDDIKPNTYYISQYGDIYSKITNKILKQKCDKDGYLELALRTIDNKGRSYKVHRLVAFAYIGKPPLNLKDPTINHIDNNIKNNHYSNLEWMERGTNSSIRKNKGKGELNHESILTENDVIKICELIVNGKYTLKQIGEMFNVSKYTISNIKRKVNWKHISQKYDFI